MKAGMADSFVDNVILFDGKYLPVEIKLSVSAEANIKQQVSKYCNTDAIILDEKDNRVVNADLVYSDHVLIIDTDHIYLFCAQNNQVTEIYDLGNLSVLSDIQELRNIIRNLI